MILFITHRIDHFGFKDPLFLGLKDEGEQFPLTVDEILTYKGEIITYELSSVLDQLRLFYKGELPNLIDISQIIKINTGRAKKSFPKNQFPWNFWIRLKSEIGEEKANSIFKILRYSNDESEIYSTLKVLGKILKRIYYNSTKILQESNQSFRFFDLENKIQQILNKRQIEGICLDLDQLNELIKKLESSKDHLINKLRYTHKITDLNYKSLRLQLIEREYHISSKDYSYFNLISFLKSAKINSQLCDDLYSALRAKADFESLSQYISEKDNLIYPVFDCIGTVTSRILIVNPHIQQLKKENRKIFIPKENYTFLYCDYNQFEPGILASFSKDKEMIDLYNSEDIYENFSDYIFGTRILRKEAKTIFLSYLYGMSDNNVVASVEKIIRNKGLNNEISASGFFSKFKELEVFKTKENDKMIKNGFIKSETTLIRYVRKTNKGKGKQSEKRFVLSQLIQGTASYILKNAILDSIQDKEIEFLIPMHDAVLFQVPSIHIKEKMLFIEKCFVDNFIKICPEIRASVDFNDFDK